MLVRVIINDLYFIIAMLVKTTVNGLYFIIAVLLRVTVNDQNVLKLINIPL